MFFGSYLGERARGNGSTCIVCCWFLEYTITISLNTAKAIANEYIRYLQAIQYGFKPPFPSHQLSRRAIWNVAQLVTFVFIRCVTPHPIIHTWIWIPTIILDETKRRIFLGGKIWNVGRVYIPTLAGDTTDRSVDSTAIIGLLN